MDGAAPCWPGCGLRSGLQGTLGRAECGAEAGRQGTHTGVWGGRGDACAMCASPALPFANPASPCCTPPLAALPLPALPGLSPACLTQPIPYLPYPTLQVMLAAQEPLPMHLLVGLRLQQSLHLLPAWGVLFHQSDHQVRRGWVGGRVEGRNWVGSWVWAGARPHLVGTND